MAPYPSLPQDIQRLINEESNKNGRADSSLPHTIRGSKQVGMLAIAPLILVYRYSLRKIGSTSLSIRKRNKLLHSNKLNALE